MAQGNPGGVADRHLSYLRHYGDLWHVKQGFRYAPPPAWDLPSLWDYRAAG